jgi:Lon protease-like protein
VAELAMFPLGSVLFPSLVLPLHIFETRYRALMRDVLAGEEEFGVCLIERGSEVGGDDVRLPVGTVAHVQEAAELPDGRWAVITVGVRRIVVDSWLPDAPYPRADVRDHPDPVPTDAQLTLLPDVEARLRSTLAKAAELGESATPATVELSDDPVLASHQMSALAPIATIDQYALLAAESVGMRLAALHDALSAADELLDLRLAAGGDPEEGR